MREALARVRKDLGAEALILGSREVRVRGWFGRGSRAVVEVVAAREAAEAPRRWRLDEGAPHAPGPSPVADGLSDLRSAVERLAREGRVEHLLPELPSSLAPAYAHLLDRDVPEPIARRAARLLADLLEPDEIGDPDCLRDALVRALELALPVAPPLAATPGTRRVAALVGPTGSGKTTTIAKLAAAAKLDAGLRVGLLTLDSDRIAGTEQLRTYAEILDVPLAAASGPGRVAAALAALGEVDLVLVDTPGRSPRDRDRLVELSGMLAVARPAEVHLVLPAPAGEGPIRAAVDAFGPLGVDRLILAKLDEADRPGAVLAAPGAAGLPFSYLTTGQTVPDDLEPARRTRLARLILGLDRPRGGEE
jgi:flagellar biosynthesis protein FlhF